MLKAVAQRDEHASARLAMMRSRQFGGFSQSDDPWHILGAAAAPALLRSAANERD